jgi:hypothetical protein
MVMRNAGWTSVKRRGQQPGRIHVSQEAGGESVLPRRPAPASGKAAKIDGLSHNDRLESVPRALADCTLPQKGSES